jgi:hypothetical protein
MALASRRQSPAEGTRYHLNSSLSDFRRLAAIMRGMKRLRSALAISLVVLLVICLLPALVAWNISWVRERDFLSQCTGPARAFMGCGVGMSPPKHMPLLWQWLGSKPQQTVILESSTSDAWYQRFVAAFPEAEVHRQTPEEAAHVPRDKNSSSIADRWQGSNPNLKTISGFMGHEVQP